MFDSGPIDVLDKLDDHIAQKPWFHSCKKEPVNLVDFFVKRNSRRDQGEPHEKSNGSRFVTSIMDTFALMCQALIFPSSMETNSMMKR